MTKFYIYVFFFKCALNYAQFSENFNNVDNSAIPAGWSSFKGDNNAGNDLDNWGVINIQTNEHIFSKCIFVKYENSGKINEDWLVTPLIDLTNYEDCFLTFYQKKTFAEATTNYQIKISLSSPSDKSSYDTIESYSESNFTTDFTLKKINLSKYNGENIYIAFVKVQDDGDNWYIDDVQVSGKANTTHLEKSDFFYPNPTSGKLSTSLNNVDSISIRNVSGLLIEKFKDVNTIDISTLQSGVYLVNVILKNGETMEQKIIKN